MSALWKRPHYDFHLISSDEIDQSCGTLCQQFYKQHGKCQFQLDTDHYPFGRGSTFYGHADWTFGYVRYLTYLLGIRLKIVWGVVQISRDWGVRLTFGQSPWNGGCPNGRYETGRSAGLRSASLLVRFNSGAPANVEHRLVLFLITAMLQVCVQKS